MTKISIFHNKKPIKRKLIRETLLRKKKKQPSRKRRNNKRRILKFFKLKYIKKNKLKKIKKYSNKILYIFKNLKLLLRDFKKGKISKLKSILLKKFLKYRFQLYLLNKSKLQNFFDISIKKQKKKVIHSNKELFKLLI